MRYKEDDIKEETRAILTILIHEIQGCKDRSEIESLLESWISANDLHPEEVLTYASMEEFFKNRK